MMNTSISSIAWALCVGLLVLETVGCATSATNVEGAWQSPHTRTEPFEAVLVVALAPGATVRRAFEITLANAIASSGNARAIPSYTLLPQSTSQLSRDIVLSMAKTTAADAVLVTRLIDQSLGEGQTPGKAVQRRGRAVAISHNEDSSLTMVIATNYSTEFQEGYGVFKADNVMDTLVYEPGAERLVYRATSRTQFNVGPENPIEKAAAVFARAIATRLRADGVIR